MLGNKTKSLGTNYLNFEKQGSIASNLPVSLSIF